MTSEGAGAREAARARVRIEAHNAPAEWYVSVKTLDGTWTLLDVCTEAQAAELRADIVADALAAFAAAHRATRLTAVDAVQFAARFSEKEVAEAVAAEREACAQLAAATYVDAHGERNTWRRAAALGIAEAIRQRGAPPKEKET